VTGLASLFWNGHGTQGVGIGTQELARIGWIEMRLGRDTRVGCFWFLSLLSGFWFWILRLTLFPVLVRVHWVFNGGLVGLRLGYGEFPFSLLLMTCRP
jgi:hypothetical protein